jgi:hypothetical protein
MAETETVNPPAAPAEKTLNDDDRRAKAAALNRKRALDDWEAKKKLWRKMGVPAPLPAKK